MTTLPDHRQLAKRYHDVPPELFARLQQFRSRYPGRHTRVAATDWHYLDGGAGGETPLLVLTGAACLAEMSWRSIEHFAERRRVIAPDYPSLDTMTELVDGIAGLLDRAGVERAHVLGGSYGGFVAQAFVQRHPDRTVSLILSHALLPDRAAAMRMAKSLRWMRWLPLSVLRTLLKLRLGKLFPEGTNAEVALSKALFVEIVDTRLTKAQILGLMRRVVDLGLNHRFTPDDLHGWPGRILLLMGDDDPATPPPARKALAEMYPRAEVRTFVGAGHLTAILKQDEYFAAMDEFLLGASAETVEERIRRLVSEEVEIVPYSPAWAEAFRREETHLRACLPADLIRRIEHFGSTAVPGLAAKPIVDMLVEVTDLGAARARIAPILESQGYDYLWRPTSGDAGPPFYAWFVKRDPPTGARTHHIHMIERSFTEHWDRLLFRDYLIEHPEIAREYQALKIQLAATSRLDRVAYTRGKTQFIGEVTERAKRRFRGDGAGQGSPSRTAT